MVIHCKCKRACSSRGYSLTLHHGCRVRMSCAKTPRAQRWSALTSSTSTPSSRASTSTLTPSQPPWIRRSWRHGRRCPLLSRPLPMPFPLHPCHLLTVASAQTTRIFVQCHLSLNDPSKRLFVPDIYVQRLHLILSHSDEEVNMARLESRGGTYALQPLLDAEGSWSAWDSTGLECGYYFPSSRLQSWYERQQKLGHRQRCIPTSRFPRVIRLMPLLDTSDQPDACLGCAAEGGLQGAGPAHDHCSRRPSHAGQ